ncbi:hypothetical protein EBT31_19740, partial [bacterium]|nr:hypothetical protein [bacterium]
MTDHSITPPQWRVQEWWEQADQYQDDPKTYFDYVATEAARWGADQELEACCALLQQKGVPAWSLLRMHRRPKPLSLKEQALQTLETEPDDGKELVVFDTEQVSILRKALEALPNNIYVPTMTDLSPAAQAVLDATGRKTWYRNDDIIAALRAAAEQVAPEQTEPPCGESEPWPQSYQLMADSKWEQRQQTRAEL